MTESSDGDQLDPGDGQRVTLGGREEPAGGDPTAGGKKGHIGTTDRIAADEPDDGSSYPVGGGDVSAGPQQPPVADPGPESTGER